MRLSSLFPFVASVALIPHTYAWGTVGHEVVATIAQMHLHPSVMPKLCDILAFHGECHLAPVATWADRIRRLPKYRWTGPLHYIGAVDDYPSAVCAFPGSQGWEGRKHINVLSAIRNTTDVLQEFEGLRRTGVSSNVGGDSDTYTNVPDHVQDALKFLIHFVGDMHMPLHLTGRHRGGNGDKVAFDGRTTNLHSVWDSLLISERLRTIPRNYTRPLPLPHVEAYLRDTIYDPYIRRLVWEGLLGKWQNELDAWVVCPPSSSVRQRQSASASASTWQSVLALFSSASKGNGEGEDTGLDSDDDNLCPYAWAKPIHQLNCDIVFPKELDLAPFHRLSSSSLAEDRGCSCGDALEGDADNVLAWTSKKHSPYLELYTPNYAGVIKEQWIIEKLLTQAGIRLAAVLNWIFAELDEDEVKRASYLTL